MADHQANHETQPCALTPGLWQALRDDGVAVDIRRGDAEDPPGGVVRLEQEGERPVDIVLGKYWWHTRALERAERTSGGVPVVTARDLVLLKLHAGGSQDLWDIRELLQLPDSGRLFAAVEVDLADLPGEMRARWDDARGSAG